MRVLIDANVVLDVLLDRQPFVDEAMRIWLASDEGVFDGCVATFMIPTIHYVCRRHAGAEAAARAVDLCLEAFETASLYRECILAARRMSGGDFEDNLQIACAITDFMQGIVTRNPRDFAASPIRVFTPAEFLRELGR
jgi:predicted nucleic acid-binding protein